MPNAILRVGPFGRPFQNQPASASFNILPINCNLRSWLGDSWKYRVGGINSGQYKSVTADNATVSESIAGSVVGHLEADGVSFAYQAAQSFTLSGTYSGTCSPGQQDFIGFGVQTIVLGSDDGPTLFGDAASQSISGSYSVTLPAAVKPMAVFLKFNSETPGNATVTISGINP